MIDFGTRKHDEGGAVAVLVAILAIVLLGMGALAVDIGHAFAKRSLVQTNVDMAVMAAAAELTGPGACNTEVVLKAEEFLEKSGNAVQQQYDVDLTNAAQVDGKIQCSNWKVELWAPASRVDYGLAQAIGAGDGMDVQAKASAQIMSPGGSATLPFFSVEGCDSGQQSIRNPSGPVTTPVVPDLQPTSDPTNNVKFTISPTSAPAGMNSFQITISSQGGFKDVDRIGFTGAGGPTYHHEHVRTTPATANDKQLTVDVPLAVLQVEDTWFVRVRTTNGRWSPTQEAQPFTVGDEKLYCDARNEGNFGTVELPRDDSPNGDWLALNMILGIQPTLAVHPSPNGECSGQAGSVESKTSPVNGTNCVASETGLKVAQTNDGLVSGAGGYPGRLDKDSTSSCSRNGTSSRTPAEVKGKHLNDDVLTCFLVNGASVGDLVSGTGDGIQALSADIFGSPRFFWIPVLDTDPATGKKSWPIVRFTPGFITDQASTATRDAPGTLTDLNGLVADSQGLTEVKVVLFSPDALPEFAPATGGEVAYTGSGTKVVVLVE